jgi:hypothetical protein
MPATNTTDHEALRALIHDRKSKKGAGRVSRTLNLCLDGDLAVAHELAVAEVTAAQERIDKWRQDRPRDAEGRPAGDRRMGDKPDDPPPGLVAELEGAEQAAAVAEKAKEPVTVQVVLAGIPNGQWDELVAANPPRDGNAQDKEYGANWSAFVADLFVECTVRVEHGGEPLDVEPADLFAGLSPGEFAMVEAALMVVNKRQVSVSFSDAASQKNRPSAGKSKRR